MKFIKKPLFGLVSAISCLGSLYTMQAMALSDEAALLASSVGAHILTSSDVQNGAFSTTGTVVIDSAISANSIAVFADNVIVLSTASLVSASTINISANQFYAQDGSLTANGLVSLFGIENFELNGDITGQTLNIVGQKVQASGDWDLSPVNTFLPPINITKPLPENNFVVDIETRDGIQFFFPFDTAIEGTIASDAGLTFTGGASRLELSPLLTIEGIAGERPSSLSTNAIGEFLINTPVNVGSLFLNTEVGTTVLKDLTLSSFGAGGEGDITILSEASVFIDRTMGVRNLGSFTLLGNMDINHPDPASAINVPFELWPGDELVIQGSASITANVGMSFVAGSLDFEPGDDIINFGVIDIDLVVTDDMPFQSDKFANFGSIDFTTTSGNTTTLNIQTTSPALVVGPINADEVNFFVDGILVQ